MGTKILFICGSLEQGLDGVGDYTRLLAGELIKKGDEVAILSLNDRYLNSIVKEIQQKDKTQISVMRIPYSVSGKSRIASAKEFISEIDPEWLSLQFVPFGFDPKGLTFGLSKLLLAIEGDRKWHIMFHELWVGMAVEESKKLLAWGFLQRTLLKSLLTNLQPNVIHTHTSLYQQYLRILGFNAEILPLFGNIPLVGVNEKKAERLLFEKTKKISFVVFGLIHSGAPIELLAKEVAAFTTKRMITTTLKFVGRCGPEKERWASAWRSEGLAVIDLGEQTVAQISAVLSNSTIGISATAVEVIEKSGSVAAMREHGLPILSVSKPWHPRNVKTQPVPQDVIVYQTGQLEQTLLAHLYLPHKVTITDIAARFQNDLQCKS